MKKLLILIAFMVGFSVADARFYSHSSDILFVNKVSPEINDRNFPYYISIDGNSMFFNTEREFNRIVPLLYGFPVNMKAIVITNMLEYDVILAQPLPESCSKYGITKFAAGTRIIVTGKLNMSDLRNPRIDNLGCQVRFAHK